MAGKKKSKGRSEQARSHKKGQGHNNFATEWLGNIQLARSFFRGHLPKLLKEGVRWNTLRKADTEFSMKALKNRKGDFLFECDIFGDPSFFYIHLEHQRAPNKSMPMRMMIYQAGIWMQFKKQYPKKREPLILPIVLYHGREPWNVEADLHSYLKVTDKMKPFTPNFRYYLVDLSHMNDNKIKGVLLLRVILLAMKHIDSPNITDYFLNVLFPMIQELLEKETGLEYIETILYYLSNGDNKHWDMEAVNKRFHELPPSNPTKEIIMSLAENWRQEGVVIGEARGELKGHQSSIWKQLQFKFQQDAEPYHSVLEKMSIKELDSVGFKLLSATTIEQVFQEDEQSKK